MDIKIPNNRRERRIAARKEQILHAAAGLFAEKGFHRTTTRDIAEAADVAEGTLYNYFESKEDLLIAILAHVSEESNMLERLSLPPDEDPRQFLLAFLLARKAYTNANKAMLQPVLSEILVNPVLRQRYHQQVIEPTIALIQHNLEGRVQRGQMQAANLTMTVHILMALLLGLDIMEFLGDPEVTNDFEALASTFTKIFFEGVTP